MYYYKYSKWEECWEEIDEDEFEFERSGGKDLFDIKKVQGGYILTSVYDFQNRLAFYFDEPKIIG